MQNIVKIIILNVSDPIGIFAKYNFPEGKFWKAGDPIVTTSGKEIKITHEFSGVSWENGFDHNDVPEELKSLIESLKPALVNFRNQNSEPIIIARVISYIDQVTPILNFDFDMIAFLHEIKAELDIDLYSVAESNETEADWQQEYWEEVQACLIESLVEFNYPEPLETAKISTQLFREELKKHGVGDIIYHDDPDCVSEGVRRSIVAYAELLKALPEYSEEEAQSGLTDYFENNLDEPILDLDNAQEIARKVRDYLRNK